MKRIASLITAVLSILIIIALSACGEDTNSENSDRTQIPTNYTGTTGAAYDTTASSAGGSSKVTSITTASKTRSGKTLSGKDETEISRIKEEADKIIDELMGDE